MQAKKLKVFLKSWGCQMNEYDTELIHAILANNGFVFVSNEQEADVVLLNTCSVRDTAERKIFGKIQEIRHQRNGKAVKIGILGCMATSQREDLLADRKSGIDFIVGPDSYRRLPDIIEKTVKDNQRLMDVTLTKEETYTGIDPLRESPVNAWVAIMRGCDNFCSFCVVPFTRGRERSRSPEDIYSEIRAAAGKGMPQVTLLGQNVNSYHSGETRFPELIEKISALPGVRRIRFMSPHPKDFPDRLLDIMAANQNICKHIHLPLQAGNNRILELMNRQYNREDYLDLVKRIRQSLPSVTLTTDIIVGFPTETDAEYLDTFRLMMEVAFDSAFIFKYSERKDTAAAGKYQDDVPENTKTERIVKLNQLQKEISLKKNHDLVGTVQQILIEQKGTERSEQDYQGRNDGNKLVIVPQGKFRVGDVISVKIQEATANILKGTTVGD
jgi:tRNA-2-methylthio-N6-dimethylallyladenosine synthase